MKCIIFIRGCVNPTSSFGLGDALTQPLIENFALYSISGSHFLFCSALTFFIAAFDVALAIYNRYAGGGGDSHNTVAYAAHMGGAMAGFLVGMNVLRNFHKLVR